MFGAREVEIMPEAPAAWLSLADAKAYLGITDAAQDALITNFVAVACAQIEGYCGALIAERDVTERMYPEDALSVLVLSHYPIIELATFTIDDEAKTLTDYRVTKPTAMVRAKDGSAIAGRLIEATYSAGYADGTVPAAIVQATKDLVRDLYNTKDRDFNVAKESVPDVGSVEYADGSTLWTGRNGIAVSAAVAASLAPFVRRGDV